MATKPATASGPYRVPKRQNGWRAFTLAVAMHAVLFFFLWGGIRWQNTEPVAVEAEVWDMTTQAAAPPPEPAPEPEPQPEPTPTPPPVEAPPPPEKIAPPQPDPEIALQKKKKEKEEKERKLAEEKRLQKLEDEKEKKKLAEEKKKQEELRLAEEKKEADKKKKLDEEKAKKLAEKKEADKLAKNREAEMRRITGAVGNGSTGSTGTAEKSTGSRVDGGYSAAVSAKVKSNIAYGGAKQDIEAVYRVSQLPTGEILSFKKIKSSGNQSYDAAVENAINKSSPLPKKKDGTVERELVLVFNLKDLP